MDKYFHPIFYNGCNYLSIMVVKLIIYDTSFLTTNDISIKRDCRWSYFYPHPCRQHPFGHVISGATGGTSDWCGSHYIDVIMTTMASQITILTVVYSTVYSHADQRKHQSSASLAFVWGIHRDRWIPRTKGQLRGKFFHLMTSSWLRKIRVWPFSLIPNFSGFKISPEQTDSKVSLKE